MNIQDIKNLYNFDFKEHLTFGEFVSDGHLIQVFKGADFDLN